MKKKRSGFGLDIRTFEGKSSGVNYIVFRTPTGAFNVFQEVEAKKAAVDCGGAHDNTRTTWKALWKQSD